MPPDDSPAKIVDLSTHTFIKPSPKSDGRVTIFDHATANTATSSGTASHLGVEHFVQLTQINSSQKR